eukprot:Platyproteum_vivax@DN12602_c0_g1_i1.p1
MDIENWKLICKKIYGKAVNFANPFVEYLDSYAGDILKHDTCFGLCNKLTSSEVTHDFTTAYTYRTFCKKACSDDSQSLEECVESCVNLCFKNDVQTDATRQWANFKFLDRSPGDPANSQTCMEICTAGCHFREKSGGFLEVEAEKEEKAVV